MLVRLSIKNFIIISNLEIELSKKCNIITGATGSGKSLLIKALNFLCAGKADSSFIKKNTKNTQVSGLYQIPKKSQAYSYLEDKKLLSKDKEPHTEVIVRRVLSEKGRSQCWINDTPVTLTTLKVLSSYLTEIVSQHETQFLLDSRYHSSILDSFLSSKTPLQKVSAAYKVCQKEFKELEQLITNYHLNREKKEYLTFKLSEFEALKPSQEDYNTLIKECQELDKKYEMVSSLAMILKTLEDDDHKFSFRKVLLSTVSQLEKLENNTKDLSSIKLSFSNGVNLIEESSYELRNYLAHINFDENLYEQSQDRLGLYQSLLRKYNFSTLKDLLVDYDQLKKQLSHIDNFEAKLASKIDSINKKVKKLLIFSNILTEERKKTSVSLQTKIIKELNDLGLTKARVEIIFLPQESRAFNEVIELLEQTNIDLSMKKLKTLIESFRTQSETGSEKIKFLFGANLGEKLQDLSQIASGGEVSRFMLTLKTITGSRDNAGLLVLDEIDTGTSGHIAHMIAKKIKILSKKRQVLCVSHLAQVAVYADKHLYIKKQMDQDRTVLIAQELTSEEQRTQAIASLLSGKKITTKSIENAKNLLIESKTT